MGAMLDDIKIRMVDIMNSCCIFHSVQEMCQRPRFNTDGGSQSDVEQGELGDAWFIGAVSSLTLTPRFLDRIVPPDQSFDTTANYCGLFRYHS